ncbi:MAG: FIST C-terminal domain-containing protein [Oscillospiraceae bacterium]|nr:FIST C-terminal domain-containing protein [Oscillospiraceae bacterium]
MDSYVIVINDIDDVDDALEELQEEMQRLSLPEKLKKNTIGIVTVRAEAIDSGVCKAVCDALPFKTAGFSSDSQNVNGEIEMYMMSVMVLTSDVCTFAAGHTTDIDEVQDAAPPVADCYNALAAELGSPPKLCLMYAPMRLERFPGEYVDTVTEIAPGVPVFGAVAAGGETFVDGSEKGITTIYAGELFSRAVVMVLIAGDIAPRFLVSTFTKECIKLRDMGTVTKCNKNIITEINNMPAVQFLKKVGFFWANSDAGLNTKANGGVNNSTLLFDYGDGIDVSRSIAAMTDNDEIVCLGNIVEGSTFSLAIATPEMIIQTAGAVMEELQACSSGALLMYSCIGRRSGLLGNQKAEFELIRDKLDGCNLNYVAAHVGGEICPAMAVNHESELLNCEHNQTLIACVLG